MTINNIAIFLVALVSQLIAVALLPRTVGFTKIGPTILCCVLFIIGVGALSRLIFKGVELGLLIPIMAAVMPLVTIVVGIVLYGESASPVKLSLLGVSCVLIGIAASRA
jgi:multidrug transporter EmrE-like cation transporter